MHLIYHATLKVCKHIYVQMMKKCIVPPQVLLATYLIVDHPSLEHSMYHLKQTYTLKKFENNLLPYLTVLMYP